MPSYGIPIHRTMKADWGYTGIEKKMNPRAQHFEWCVNATSRVKINVKMLIATTYFVELCELQIIFHNTSMSKNCVCAIFVSLLAHGKIFTMCCFRSLLPQASITTTHTRTHNSHLTLKDIIFGECFFVRSLLGVVIRVYVANVFTWNEQCTTRKATLSCIIHITIRIYIDRLFLEFLSQQWRDVWWGCGNS